MMRNAALALALLVGCGGGGLSEPSASALVSPAPPASPPAPASPKVGYWECNGSAAHTFALDTATLEYVCTEKTTGTEVGRYFNASNLGLVAMPPARPDLSQRDMPFSSSCNQDGPLTDRQHLAVRLLHEKARPLGQGAAWFYDYEGRMNDRKIAPPYPSAFAQAANIHGLLFAYCKSANVDHLALAVKAGDGLLTPVAQGGMLNGDWFEEQPEAPGYMPYILNGHLYSVAVLYLLADMSGAERFRLAADAGVEAFDRYGLWFDAGVWTRYDLRPRWSNIQIEVHFGPATNISRIDVEAGTDVYSVCATGCSKTFGEARNGNSFRLSAELPSLEEYEPAETVGVEVTFSGPDPAIYSGVARPDRVEIWKTGDGAHVDIPIADNGWSTLPRFYQQWHAFLAREIYERTGKPRHYVLAARWSNYLNALEADIAEQRERDRPFVPTWDDAADAKIAACLGGDPGRVDMSKLEACGLAALAPRVGGL